MNFRKVEVKSSMVYLQCPDCGGDLYQVEGIALMSNPPKCYYDCSLGHRHIYESGYPKVEYEEVIDDDSDRVWKLEEALRIMGIDPDKVAAGDISRYAAFPNVPLDVKGEKQ